MEKSLSTKKTLFDVDALLHPARAFRHPMDVARDDDLTLAEKRSVLASWASDVCAIESNPVLRSSATGNVVSYDDIIDALQSLDAGQSADAAIYAFKRRQRRRRLDDWKGRRRGGHDNGDVGSNVFD